jgi:hypothetical protein
MPDFNIIAASTIFTKLYKKGFRPFNSQRLYLGFELE